MATIIGQTGGGVVPAAPPWTLGRLTAEDGVRLPYRHRT